MRKLGGWRRTDLLALPALSLTYSPRVTERRLKLTLTLLSEPLGLIALSIFASTVVLMMRDRRRTTFFISIALICIFGFFTTPLGANALVKPLEARARDDAACAITSDRTLIILLTGGIRGSASPSDGIGALTEASFRRTIAAVDRLQSQPGSVLLISGGGRSLVREADVVAQLAQRMGAAPDDIIVELESRTTAEAANALRYQSSALHAQRVELVTSAMHMPRARASLSKSGITTCPVPVDYQYVDVSFRGALLPQISALRKSTLAMHEYIGWVVYGIVGQL